MKDNSLTRLRVTGQRVWVDYLSRDIIRSGELKRLIDEDGLCGVTSNPTIFQKAIEGSDLYDDQIKEALPGGVKDSKGIFLELAMKDVGDAADILRPVYEASGGADGYVSIEVSPDLAYDTDATVEEALMLFNTIGRKNILVKVPATTAGIPAIERLTAEGVNVNVTLLFSVKRYVEVAKAYIRGVRTRIDKGLPVDGVHSVASFFVSRVDTAVDGLLDERLAKGPDAPSAQAMKSLRGKAAVANARIAYGRFKGLFLCPSFIGLADKGANAQRLLWASTGAKDPAYRDVKYVEELIGPDTVVTMPEETISAFRDHGVVTMTLDGGQDEAKSVMAGLAGLGMDIEELAGRLEKDGVKKFTDSYLELLSRIDKKREARLTEAA